MCANSENSGETALAGAVSWSLIRHRCAAGTLITHPIHVYSICEKAYTFISTSHNLYPINAFGTFPP